MLVYLLTGISKAINKSIMDNNWFGHQNYGRKKDHGDKFMDSGSIRLNAKKAMFSSRKFHILQTTSLRNLIVIIFDAFDIDI